MTAPSSAPPQFSPDGQWWWDGSAWIPAPQPPAGPPMTPPQAAVPQAQSFPPAAAQHVPAPTSSDGKAVASLVLGILWLGGLGSVVAVILGHLSRAASRKERRPPSGLALAGLILGYIGVASLALILSLFIAGAAVFSSQQHTAQAAAVKSDLRTAALAEETYLTDNMTGYTTSMSDLAQEGFTPSADVDVTIISADSHAYCLAGALTDGSARAYLDSSTGSITSQPCS